MNKTFEYVLTLIFHGFFFLVGVGLTTVGITGKRPRKEKKLSSIWRMLFLLIGIFLMFLTWMGLYNCLTGDSCLFDSIIDVVPEMVIDTRYRMSGFALIFYLLYQFFEHILVTVVGGIIDIIAF